MYHSLLTQEIGGKIKRMNVLLKSDSMMKLMINMETVRTTKFEHNAGNLNLINAVKYGTKLDHDGFNVIDAQSANEHDDVRKWNNR